MISKAKHLAVRPEADTEAVEDLVARVMRGVVRIPVFQRGLRWESNDVIALFESIYRGYPIGSLLLRKGPAEAVQLALGPLTINAPETQAALWVIDGQQRITALTAGLARPTPVPVTPTDPYVVYFDAEQHAFAAPHRSGDVPDTWVPVAHLLNASSLSEWIFNWKHAGNVDLRTSVFDAGARIRQYRVPIYVVETDDQELLRDIFYRTNNSGRPLTWKDVHDALFGHTGESPSTLKDLADELLTLGMGRPDEDQLLSCLVAFRGLDVTRSVSEHYQRDPEILRNTVSEALPVLRRVLSFLRIEAEIPHLRLLPRSLPLVVLSRFFAVFPDPSQRTLQLLTRWTWRTLLSTSFFDERTLLRRGIAGINPDDEEVSAQGLLELVPRSRSIKYSLPKRFDARAAESRLALLGLASLGPLTLDDHHPLDTAVLIEHRDVDAFRSIFSSGKPMASSPANRILLPGNGIARSELMEAAKLAENEQFFSSHGISGLARGALLQGNYSAFLSDRGRVMEDVVQEMGDRLAAWSRSDRPSISYLLQQADGDD